MYALYYTARTIDSRDVVTEIDLITREMQVSLFLEGNGMLLSFEHFYNFG